MSVINFGSLNVDHTYRVKNIVQPGETIQASDYNIYCGGKGLNQSVAAARAGAKVLHAGMLGKGGDILADTLRESGIDMAYIGTPDVPQGHAIIQVADSGENSIFLFCGSNFAITKEYADRVLDAQKEKCYVMLQNEISEVEYIISTAYQKGFPVVFNASPINETITKIDLKKVSWLLVNEIEGAALTGEQSPEKIIEKLRAANPDIGIVLTLGKEGAICSKGDALIHQGIYPVTAVDTTGAGDTFTGYFVAALDEGKSLEKAMQNAAAAAAISVTRKGASPSIPVAEEVEKFIQERS